MNEMTINNPQVFSIACLAIIALGVFVFTIMTNDHVNIRYDGLCPVKAARNKKIGYSIAMVFITPLIFILFTTAIGG